MKTKYMHDFVRSTKKCNLFDVLCPCVVTFSDENQNNIHPSRSDKRIVDSSTTLDSNRAFYSSSDQGEQYLSKVRSHQSSVPFDSAGCDGSSFFAFFEPRHLICYRQKFHTSPIKQRHIGAQKTAR